MYYNGDKILNRRMPFNFLLGNRGIGKTFFWTKYGFNKFKKSRGKTRRSKFIYVRRYDSDLQKIKDSVFDTVAQHLNFNYKIDGNQIFIQEDGEFVNCGYMIAVTQFTKYKSSDFHDVDLIVFDEFLPEDKKYLGGKERPLLEPELCLNFYQSVARGFNNVIRDDVLFIFIGNAVSINNPYFYFYGIDKKITLETKFFKGNGFNVEITYNQFIAEQIRQSKFGQLIENTKYGDYALTNSFYLDDNNFIDPMKNVSKQYMYTFIYDGMQFGLYLCDGGIYWISESVDKYCKDVFCLSQADHSIDCVLISMLDRRIFKNLRNQYAFANLRFQNQRCKSFFEAIIK